MLYASVLVLPFGYSPMVTRTLKSQAKTEIPSSQLAYPLTKKTKTKISWGTDLKEEKFLSPSEVTYSQAYKHPYIKGLTIRFYVRGTQVLYVNSNQQIILYGDLYDLHGVTIVVPKADVTIKTADLYILAVSYLSSYNLQVLTHNRDIKPEGIYDSNRRAKLKLKNQARKQAKRAKQYKVIRITDRKH